MAEKGRLENIRAVGASTRPRAVEGSYMPCFLAGEGQGRGIAAALGVPFYAHSHQQGHLAAAAWSAGRLDVLDAPFLAWHLSGGTTELLLVKPEGFTVTAEIIGGTSDLAACEEAALTAEALGSRVHRGYDAGVAGLHRLLGSLETLEKARCIVAVAGMEGALPSVVGGLVSCPVIAVPTSVGYGANLGGLAALLAMLNSCASGVSVVNIDNGFGAGFLAHRINQMKGIDQ